MRGMPNAEEALRETFSGPVHAHPGAWRVLEEAGPQVEDDLYFREEWKLACDVAASRGLSRSSLLPKFLLYVCEQSLRGNSRELTEQRIGTFIFNRAPDYNPGEDNIVRSYARTLRRRLDDYFETEGRNATMRIVIPRGGYVPTFECVKPTPDVSTNSPVTLPVLREAPLPQGAATMSYSKRFGAAALLGFLLGVVLSACVWITLRQTGVNRLQSPSHPIWAELFRQNHNSLIVPADSGLGILQNLSGQTVSLQEYVNGDYVTDTKLPPGINPGALADLRQQRYTSVVDLDITTRIMQLPEVSASRTEIRYARSITTEDLKSSDVILIGSVHSNPWVALFEDKLNFKLQYLPEVDQSYVLNSRPVGNEQKQYLNGTSQTSNQTYGVIDYLPNLDGSGHVLIIQGLNMAATQAAADTLFHADAMKAILKQALRPDGTLRGFELLIQTRSIGATDPGSQIISTRFSA
jgi:hypothetical protein